MRSKKLFLPLPVFLLGATLLAGFGGAEDDEDEDGIIDDGEFGDWYGEYGYYDDYDLNDDEYLDEDTYLSREEYGEGLGYDYEGTEGLGSEEEIGIPE